MTSMSKTFVKETTEHAESGDYGESSILWEDLLGLLYDAIGLIIDAIPALAYIIDYTGLDYNADEDGYYSFNSDSPSKTRKLVFSYGLKTIDFIIKLI